MADILAALTSAANSLRGLTGAPIHAGSGFQTPIGTLFKGAPDFGISEVAQGQVSTSPSPTGLSTGALNQPYTMPTTNTSNSVSTTDLAKATDSGALKVSSSSPSQSIVEGDRGWAQRIIEDMNSGKIGWDDNLRAKANNILSPAPTNPTLGEQGVKDIIRGIPGATEADFGSIDISKYANETRDRMGAIASEIENTLKANAEAEYRDTMAALGVQRSEVGTVSAQQKKNVADQKALTEQDLSAKSESEKKNIGEQSDTFASEINTQKEQLARNCRDLSMRTQAIMRARGTSESSYASDKETSLMLDFNKGLRALSKSSTDALQNFSDAIVETDKFYTRQAAQLDFDTNKAIQDIDTWARQKVQDIQAQENKAMSTKLAEIRQAVTDANTMRVQTEQKIADQKQALDTWLVQTSINYKIAVATAAQGKVQSASDLIKQSAQYASSIQDILSNGGKFVTDASTGKSYVQDLKGNYYPATQKAFDVYAQEQQDQTVGSVLKNNAAITALQTNPALAAMYPNLASQVNQTGSSGGGIFSGITDWLSSLGK